MKKEFTARVFDLDNKTLLVHIISLTISNLNVDVHSFCRALIALWIIDQAFIVFLFESVDCVDVLSSNFAAKLSKYTKINNHFIDLVKDYQPSYKFIYNLKIIELETLKTYIKVNLVNGFIKSSKSLINVLIFFV